MTSFHLIVLAVSYRDNIQVKSHGHLLIGHLKRGIDIYAELEVFFREQQQQAWKNGQYNEPLDRYGRQSMMSETYSGGTYYHNRRSLHPRPPKLQAPSDVLDAACGLSLLSEANDQPIVEDSKTIRQA